jgi:hypothetical protein
VTRAPDPGSGARAAPAPALVVLSLQDLEAAVARAVEPLRREVAQLRAELAHRPRLVTRDGRCPPRA